MRIDDFSNKITALLFPKHETMLELGSEKIFETTELNHWVDKENELVNQSTIVQYIHEVNFEKGLFESLVEDTIEYEKQILFVKHTNVRVGIFFKPK